MAPTLLAEFRGHSACRRPVSRILSWTIIPLGGTLPRRSSNLPASSGCLRELAPLQALSAWAHRADTLLPAGECGHDPCLFGLAPCGVYHALPLTRQPVRSYRTFSPLPPAACIACLRWRSDGWRYLLCCTGRLCALTHRSRTLSGTLPCGVRTFLPLPAADRGRQRSSSRLQP